MLVGKTERRDVPGEPGQWMEFRLLTGPEWDEAEAVALTAFLRFALGLGLNATALEAERQRWSRLDKDTLLRYGVVAWSLDVPCDEENKAQLTAGVRDWASSVVEEMNTRPLGAA